MEVRLPSTNGRNGSEQVRSTKWVREKVRGRLRVPVVFGLKKSYFFFFFAAFFAGFFAAFFLVAMLSILPFHFSWNIAISTSSQFVLCIESSK